MEECENTGINMYKQAIVNNLIKIAVVNAPSAKDLLIDAPNSPYAGYRNANTIGAGVGGLTGAALGAGAGYLYNRNKKNKYNQELAKINANKQLNDEQRANAIAALKKPSLAKHMLVGGTAGGLAGAGAGYLIGNNLKNKDINWRATHKIYNPKYSVQEGPNVETRTVKKDYESAMPGETVGSNNGIGHAENHPKNGYIVRRDGNRYSIEVPTATGRRDNSGRSIVSFVQFGGDINDLTPDKVNQIMGSIANRGNFVEPGDADATVRDNNINSIIQGTDLEAKKNLSQQYVDALLSGGDGYMYTPKGTAWSTSGEVDNEDDVMASVYDLLTNKDTQYGIAGQNIVTPDANYAGKHIRYNKA